jgi:hypothetical protein
MRSARLAISETPRSKRAEMARIVCQSVLGTRTCMIRPRSGFGSCCSIVMRRSITNHKRARQMRKHRQKTVSFVPPNRYELEVEQLTQGWLRDRNKRGYFKDTEFKNWAEKTTEGAKQTLIHLLRRYQIQPFDILETLAVYKTEEWFHTDRTVTKKLRSAAGKDCGVCGLEQRQDQAVRDTYP